MDKKEWIEHANRYKGVLVLWIDQATDPMLRVANSKGFCFAMSFDFVTAYQMGQPGPSNFVNEIRNAALRWPYTSRIPFKYIEIQDTAQAMFDQYRRTLIKLNNQLVAAEANGKMPILIRLKQLLADRIKQRFGPGMDAFTKFKESNVLASIKIFNTMKEIVAIKGPSYFLVSLRGDSGGHAISFGFRPDLSASGNFPGIFEYFDANLGLFVFGTVEELSDFFQVAVWSELYGMTDYNDFKIASFIATQGRR